MLVYARRFAFCEYLLCQPARSNNYDVLVPVTATGHAYPSAFSSITSFGRHPDRPGSNPVTYNVRHALTNGLMRSAPAKLVMKGLCVQLYASRVEVFSPRPANIILVIRSPTNSVFSEFGLRVMLMTGPNQTDTRRMQYPDVYH